MKKTFKIIVSIAVAIMLITILKPFVDDYKEQKQYDFTINTIDGEKTKESFKGKVLAVYFGYTFCPDVCPTSLSSLAQALNQFPQEETEDFVGLFISVDPERDTVQNLKNYAAYFHPNFIGGTTDETNINDITSRYKSYYRKVILEDSAMGYSIEHTSYIYLFDREGKFITRIDHFSDPQSIKESLEKVLN